MKCEMVARLVRKVCVCFMCYVLCCVCVVSVCCGCVCVVRVCCGWVSCVCGVVYVLCVFAVCVCAVCVLCVCCVCVHACMRMRMRVCSIKAYTARHGDQQHKTRDTGERRPYVGM